MADLPDTTPQPIAGWWNPQPYSSRSKFHYVGTDSRSLCGKWARIDGCIEDGLDDHPDNCAACRRKLVRLKGK
jgi:hypothetical protein